MPNRRKFFRILSKTVIIRPFNGILPPLFSTTPLLWSYEKFYNSLLNDPVYMGAFTYDISNILPIFDRPPPSVSKMWHFTGKINSSVSIQKPSFCWRYMRTLPYSMSIKGTFYPKIILKGNICGGRRSMTSFVNAPFDIALNIIKAMLGCFGLLIIK